LAFIELSLGLLPVPGQEVVETVDWVLSDAADTSASHARGSTSFILAVYAARRTIPNRLVFLRIRSDWHMICSA
jgi:hypothetical protein